MNTTYTPGPWVVKPATKAFIVHTMRGATVARVGGSSYGTPHEQRYADARLIAAAPDLLDALRALADAVDRFAPNPGDWPELAVARATIERTGA